MKLGCTVAELESKLEYAELIEWFAFYQLEPWGAEWHRSSAIAATIANCHLDRHKQVDLDCLVPTFESESDSDDLNAEFIAQMDKAIKKSKSMKK